MTEEYLEHWRCPVHGAQFDLSHRCPECDRPLAPPGRPAIDYTAGDTMAFITEGVA